MSLDVDHLCVRGLEALEVVGDVSVRSQLGHGRARVLGHDVRHVGAADLELVGGLLVIGPSLFASTLLVGQPLVVSLQLLQLQVLLHGHLVLEHASHAGDVVGLFGVLSLLVLGVIDDSFFLGVLLGNPVGLKSGILNLTVPVVYKEVIKAAA